MDVFYAYTYSTAGWLGLQSAALIIMPRFITTLLLEETRPASDLEIYFARCVGFSLLAITVLTGMLTGSIPLTSTLSEPVTAEDSDPKAPYAVPTLTVTSVFQAACAIHAYSWYLASGRTAFVVATAGYAAVTAVGLWCVLFASSRGRISRRTGADKRTTGFPFKNAEAAKKHAGKKRL